MSKSNIEKKLCLPKVKLISTLNKKKQGHVEANVEYVKNQPLFDKKNHSNFFFCTFRGSSDCNLILTHRFFNAMFSFYTF